MIVRFLKNTNAPVRTTEECGDGCCSWDSWDTDFIAKGEQSDAVMERQYCYEDGTVDVSDLKFGEDYEIIEFP